MEQPAGILPSNRPCGSTVYLSIPKPAARIHHSFVKLNRGYPTLSTIDGRLFYSFGERGINAIDMFCDAVIFIPYHLNKVYGPEFIQITADTFIYRIGIKVLKIRVYLDQYRPAMETIDEQIFERSFGCSERIVGERYIIYQWNENNYVNLNLFNIDDIHVPLQTFRLDKEPRHEPNIFGLFTIHEEKLYFFTKFDNPAADNERMVLNLGSLHVYDMKTGRKHIEATSTLPSFHYSPPNNIIGIQRLFIHRAFWVGSQIYVRIKEVENQVPIYHLICLDINTLTWHRLADADIEMKLTSLIDENGVMTLINVREDNRVQTYFRKPMLQPESLRNLAQFAVKRTFPKLYKMCAEERISRGFPPHLPFTPLFRNNEHEDTYSIGSVKTRVASFIRWLLT